MGDERPFGGPVLVELRTVVDGFVRCATSLQRLNGYVPAPAAPLESELGDQEVLAGGWGEQPVRQAVAVGALGLFAAGEHLRGVSRLVGDPPFYYPAAVAVRACLEASGRASWLLEPSMGPRERVARGMTERLHGLWQTAQLPAELASQVDTAGRTQSILDAAREHGFTVVPGTRGRPPAVGGQRPGARKVVQLLLDDEEVQWADVLYGHLAGIAHAGTDLVHTMKQTGVLGDVPMGSQEIRLQDVGQLLAVASFGYKLAVDQEMRLYGWEASDWHSWAAHAVPKLLRILHAAGAPEQ